MLQYLCFMKGIFDIKFFNKNCFLNKQESIQSNVNHLLAESSGYIKSEWMYIFYFDLNVTFVLMYELYLIND